MTLAPAPELSVRFDTAQNAIIEGDNLPVLKLLQAGYQGRVKMIYIDPPYNTGGDFVYADNFRQSEREWRREADPVGPPATPAGRRFLPKPTAGSIRAGCP
jgi:adenine-specific DNA-methyltransferase